MNQPNLTLETTFDDIEYELTIDDLLDDQEYLTALEHAGSRSVKRKAFATPNPDAVGELQRRLETDDEGLCRTIFSQHLGLQLFSMYLDSVSSRVSKDRKFFAILKDIVASCSDQPQTKDEVVRKIIKCTSEDLQHLNSLSSVALDTALQKFKKRSACPEPSSISTDNIDGVSKSAEDAESDSPKKISTIHPSAQQRRALFGDASGDSETKSGPPPNGQAWIQDAAVAKNNMATFIDEARDALIVHFKLKIFPGFMKSVHYTRYLEFRVLAAKTLSAADFTQFRVLGRGGYGEVCASRKNDTGELYAMKRMSKARIKAKHAEHHVMNERNMLCSIDNPFVISLHYAFQDETSVYLMMDLCTGGDLAYHLSRNRKGSPRRCRTHLFPEARMRIIAAEMVVGIGAMHDARIVYRDLKPHNVMLSADGHVRLSDLGLAVRLAPGERLRHRSGTAGYWAPEVARKGDSYSFECDWWSLGVTLFELVTTIHPFKSGVDDTRPKDERVRQIKENVLRREVTYPDTLSPFCRDFLAGLMTRDVSARLGSKGVREVMEHPFFDGIDWDMLMAEQLGSELGPMFAPSRNRVHAHSMANLKQFSRVTKERITAEDHVLYEGFEYNNPLSFQNEVAALITRDPKAAMLSNGAPVGCCIVM